MTGGGFGGSTVSLVRRERLAEKTYASRFNRPPNFYVSDAGRGDNDERGTINDELKEKKPSVNRSSFIVPSFL